MLTASIVLYKNDKEILIKAIQSFQNSAGNLNKHLFLIDNSPTDILKNNLLNIDSLTYIHNPSNLGFGKAHNLALKYSIDLGSKYHIIINPDVYFSEDVIMDMIFYMDNNIDVGMMMPKILNKNGSIQYLPKLLPTPFDIVLRKAKRPKSLYNKYLNKYELRNVSQKNIFNTPIISGCFTLLRIDAIKSIGLYDENYFMYFEDWDLSRRMHNLYKTIYFPTVSIFHLYESGANKSIRLFIIYLKSSIYYFNKWSWFFDKERKKINSETLNQFINEKKNKPFRGPTKRGF